MVRLPFGLKMDRKGGQEHTRMVNKMEYGPGGVRTNRRHGKDCTKTGDLLMNGVFFIPTMTMEILKQKVHIRMG